MDFLDEHYYLYNDKYYVNCDTKKKYPVCKSCFELKRDLMGPFSRECISDCIHYKKKIVKEKKLCFITIQDFQTRMNDIPKLKSFIDDISHFYECGEWVIETGKNEEEFNIHIHLLVKIKPMIKNHKRDIDIAWKRYRNTSLYDSDYYLIKQWRKSKDMPSYETWLKEKREYFINDKKSSEHKNTMDLGLCGKF